MTVSAQARPEWPHVARAHASVRERNLVVDTMRGVAILMVIGIHSLPNFHGSALVTAIDAILRPCVPVFLFVSGYLTAKAGHVPFMKRLKRTLAPYTIAFVAAYAFMAANNPAMDHRLIVTVARYGLAYVFVYYYVFIYIGCTAALWLVLVAAGEGEDRHQRLLVLLAISIFVGLAVGAYVDPLLRHFGLSDSLVEEARLRDVPFWFTFMAVGAIAGAVRADGVFHEMRHLLAAATVIAYLAYAAIRIAGLGDAAAYDSIAFFLYATLFCVTMLGFAYSDSMLAPLGSASYFIYLWHIFPIMALRQVPGLQLHWPLSTAVEYAAALTFCLVLLLPLRRLAGPRLTYWLGI
jgi:surface polysaccharide O-acyltransferase-like enzyme